MNKLIYLTIFVAFRALISCQNKTEKDKSYSSDILLNIDTSVIDVIQLPRPNSGTYSYAEAEKRKGEIFNMQLTRKYFEWKNPTTGGAVHINKQDEIEVYQFTIGMMYLDKTVNKFGDTGIIKDPAPKDTFFVVRKNELKHHVGGIGMGNPASVLITSEYDLTKSKSIGLILDELFEPGTQLYYLKKK